MTYGDVFHQAEVEYSHYNFEVGDVALLTKLFDMYSGARRPDRLPLPADYVLKCSHAFNLSMPGRHQ